MRPAHEANVTNAARPIGAPDAKDSPAAGVWTLAGDRLIIAEGGGPATILVPAEQVRLLAVDLPLASAAKRLAALPFAVEDRIAEPLESVHLALGTGIAPRRYLVGVVSHEVMAGWVEVAAAAGLGHAAMVPDALALPLPAEGGWAVDLAGDRALVRAADGTGFAVPAALLVPAWQSAGRPVVTSYGEPLPMEMAARPAGAAAERLANRLLAPPLDLRQPPYGRTRPVSTVWRRLGWIAAIGVAAHVAIGFSDTLMLRVIADRRAAETRALAAIAAPGAALGEDLAGSVTALLPTGGGSAAPDLFLPLLNRLSGALTPLSGSVAVRALRFEGRVLTLDLDGTDPALGARVEAAIRGSGTGGTVTRTPDGAVRITASVA
jgi:general secretion pathway protein L